MSKNQNCDYDVVIIGGGVIGCAVARELSRYQLSICLVEKEEDVCAGTSKANSAIIHAGHDALPGSLKARFNIEGNRMMEQLALDLDFDFKRNGSLVLCLTKEELPALQSLYEKGIQNGVPGLTMISGEEAKNMESNLSESVVAALYAPTGGIVCPFGLTIALAENACDNGVEFRLETEVRTVEKSQKGYRILLNDGEISAAYVVNAAGVYGDVFHNKMTDEKIHITARKGEYCLLDKEAGNHVSHTVFQLPNKFGKGVLVTPTVHGNLLIGPTAVDIEEKECTATTAEGLAEVMTKAAVGVEAIPVGQV
ncbi:MAG: NAD(P)/FAD-dependent oxidoreductase, partial [Hungatella sp.]